MAIVVKRKRKRRAFVEDTARQQRSLRMQHHIRQTKGGRR